MKKILLLLCVLVTLLCLGVLQAISPEKIFPTSTRSLSIGWVGDMVPAESDVFNNSVFSSVAPFTRLPSLMIGNLEGTFAQETRASKCVYLGTQCHAFRGGISFAYALKDAGFDIVSLVNNHSYDFGDEGLSDTEDALTQAGIPFISQTHPTASLVVQGKRIGILGVSFTPPSSTITDYNFITREIASLKQKNDIVILVFHGGAEGSDKTVVTGSYEYLGSENRGNVQLVAHTAIDAGADIVLGSGPHVLRKIEYYNNKPIIYSAGNFVGGNERLQTKGFLGVSALFTIEQKEGSSPVSVHSVVLSKEGVPFIDPLEQGKSLIESLSK